MTPGVPTPTAFGRFFFACTSLKGLTMKRSLALAAILLLTEGVGLAATPAGTKLADEANAASTQFKLAAPAVVSYGAGTSWTERTLDAGITFSTGARIRFGDEA